MNKAKYLNQAGEHFLLFGAGGIGSEIVKALVANGAKAASFTYNSKPESALKLQAELAEAGIRAHIGTVDMLNEISIKNFITEAEAAHGLPVSIMVNAVGISPNTPLEDQTLTEWEKVFKVNVFGSFFATRVTAMHMRENGIKGSIVLITSTNGINSQSSISTHYDASKAAQSHTMRILAEHFAPFGIRINGIAPGWIDTEMNKTLPEDERVKEMSRIWSKRFADPAEVAKLVAFVAGSGGSYIIGQDLMIDGGYR